MPVRVLLVSLSALVLGSCAQGPEGKSSAIPAISQDFETCAQDVRELNHSLLCNLPNEGSPIEEMVKLSEAERESFFVRIKCGGMKGDPYHQPANWKEMLADCPTQNTPITLQGWFKDLTTDPYHPGASTCYRKKISKKTWPEIAGESWSQYPRSVQKILALNPPGQQCCYDTKNELIVSGPGAGTPDLVSVDNETHKGVLGFATVSIPVVSSLEAHLTMDVRIIDKCFFPKDLWKLKNWETYHKLGWEPNVPKK